MAARWLILLIGFFITACAAQLPTPTATAVPVAVGTISVAELTITATSIATTKLSNPGPGSALVSPIRLQLKDSSGVIRVDVRGLDGTLLARHLPDANVDIWLPFAVEASTPALLVISIEDEYGRLLSVNSVGVELLPSGESRLEPEGNPAIKFSAPQEGMRIEGSSVRIYAFVDSEDGRAFNIRMITREGRVVASQDVYSKDGIVQAEVQANIDQPAFVRITISRSVNGVVFDLNSVEVELIP